MVSSSSLSFDSCAEVGHFFLNGKEFVLLETLPSSTSIAITAIIPYLLSTTRDSLSQYGVLGELVRVGSVTVLYGVTLYV